MPQLQTRIRDLARYGDPSRYFTVQKFPPPEDKRFTIHFEYRYKFPAPPKQKNDDLICMVIKAIRELSRDNMLLAASGIWPHAMNSTLPIWPGQANGATKILDDRKSPGAQEGEERRKIQRTVDSSEEVPPEYRSSRLLTEGENRNGVPRAIIAQQTWWAKNGKRFRLMALPPEIRAIIFRQALGENIYPNARHDDALGVEKVTLGSRKGNIPHDDLEYDVGVRPDPLNYAVLCLNKSLRSEALKAGLEGTRKHFVDFRSHERVVTAAVTPSRYNWLSRIHLSQNITQYFERFGVSINPVIHLQHANRNGALLQKIPSLKNLELYFQCPYRVDNDANIPNPWYDFYMDNYLQVSNGLYS
ncbi:hypothetical protein BDW02DRAFT_605237 [Decorospora gaudefroyi]|uniref:Uncharacterized protein n=1 Tax=Decorospora gaudefroyi TaxID=184978 RepID=A0A6A5KAX6_9PLEO|nr:hypothetical protein BDW02DRAFT_605237 [Decorospora gaudefroyi]